MEYIKLGDIATYINGYSFKPSDWKTEGTPIVRIQNLTGFNGNYNYTDKEVDSKYKIKRGDILISWSASIGVYEWEGEDAFLNQHIFKVEFNKICINKQYFKYAVEQSLDKAIKFMHGSTMKHITKKYFDNILIPVPNLEQQEKIVKILNKAESLINMKRAQLDYQDELVKSRFVEMFGDPIKNNKRLDIVKLGELINIISGYAFKSTKFVDTGVPVLRIGNINSGYFKSSNLKFWNKDDNLDKYLVKPNDLVISLTGTVGKDDYGNICVIENDYEEYYLNQRNAKLEINDEMILNKYYLVHLLKMSEIKKRLTSIGRGVRQANISNSDIQNLEIILPPIELQNQFADFVTQVDKLKFEMEKSLKELENNFNSLMQKAFKGELF